MATKGRRLIDQDERARKKPMRILVLGMCRTGTTSLSVALRKLGYTPHQMRDVLAKPQELKLWQEAIDTTFPLQNHPSKQQAYGRSEFDKLLGDYDVAMDVPSCVFAKELIEAYPEAKVILTNREYTDWEKSMQESIWCLDTWRLFTLCRSLNITQLAPLMRLIHAVFRAHNRNNYGGPVARSAYEKHYDTVRSLVPKGRVLEIEGDAETRWEPLCEFLGRTVPNEQFPRLNEEKAMRNNLDNAWWGMVSYLFLMMLLPGMVALGALWLYFYHGELLALIDESILIPLKEYMQK